MSSPQHTPSTDGPAAAQSIEDPLFARGPIAIRIYEPYVPYEQLQIRYYGSREELELDQYLTR